MIYQRQAGHCPEYCPANALGVAPDNEPGVASAKLDGFIIITAEERRKLSAALDEVINNQAKPAAA